jgi:hypothetical protein
MINKGTKGNHPPNMRTILKAIIITSLGALIIAIAPTQTVNHTTVENPPVAAAKAPEPIIPAVVPVEPVVEPVQAPQEQPAPAVAAPTPTGDCSLAFNYDWPQQVAYAVCMAESGGNPNSANWNDNHMSWAGCMGSFGLMQINCSHGQLFDGQANMDVAYSMYKSWGNSFRAWTTCSRVIDCR